ncbi:hypothetical protein ACRBEV_15355 [Methylobacterium phyllosphaerae]
MSAGLNTCGDAAVRPLGPGRAVDTGDPLSSALLPGTSRVGVAAAVRLDAPSG